MVWKGSSLWGSQGYTRLVLTEVAAAAQRGRREKGWGFVITQWVTTLDTFVIGSTLIKIYILHKTGNGRDFVITQCITPI